MSGQTFLFAIENNTPYELQFTNREYPSDSQPIAPNGVTLTLGKNGDGCDIPDCTGQQWWGNPGPWTASDPTECRMVITGGPQTGAQAFINLFKQGSQIYALQGDLLYPPTPQLIPGLNQAGNNIKTTLVIDAINSFSLEAYSAVYPAYTALSAAASQLLLDKFAPVVMLHGKEKYFPCPMEWYFTKTTLTAYTPMVGTGLNVSHTLQTNVTDANLVAATQTGYVDGLYAETYYSQFIQTVDGNWPEAPFYLPIADSSTYPGLPPSSSSLPYTNSPYTSTPFYGAVIDRLDSSNNLQFYDLLYIFVYAYNGPSMNDPGWVGTHQGDLEHVVVRVSADQTHILGVYMQAHGAGDKYTGWYYPPDTPNQNCFDYYSGSTTRPKVYSSYGGHASYPSARGWPYSVGRGTDQTADGWPWNPVLPNVQVVAPGATAWLQYAGHFGAPAQLNSWGDPPSPPLSQGWFNLLPGGPTS
ncbi:protein of unknown function [Rhizobiales bacterium GAS188]|nr:protein of unknown function [Rhizobiales bacterium GAS188]